MNIASVAGLRAAPLQGVYGMTKAALISMTQTLAHELGSLGLFQPVADHGGAGREADLDPLRKVAHAQPLEPDLLLDAVEARLVELLAAAEQMRAAELQKLADDLDEEPAAFAVAMNGTIAMWGQSKQKDDTHRFWATVLPDTIQPGFNDIQIFELEPHSCRAGSPTEACVSLLPVALTSAPDPDEEE